MSFGCVPAPCLPGQRAGMTQHIGVPVLSPPGRRVGKARHIGVGKALDSVLNMQMTNFEMSHNFSLGLRGQCICSLSAPQGW